MNRRSFNNNQVIPFEEDVENLQLYDELELTKKEKKDNEYSDENDNKAVYTGDSEDIKQVRLINGMRLKHLVIIFFFV